MGGVEVKVGTGASVEHVMFWVKAFWVKQFWATELQMVTLQVRPSVRYCPLEFWVCCFRVMSVRSSAGRNL